MKWLFVFITTFLLCQQSVAYPSSYGDYDIENLDVADKEKPLFDEYYQESEQDNKEPLLDDENFGEDEQAVERPLFDQLFYQKNEQENEKPIFDDENFENEHLQTVERRPLFDDLFEIVEPPGCFSPCQDDQECTSNVCSTCLKTLGICVPIE